MGRYLGPICRLCRREGVKLCDKHKCASVRRPFPPGMHGKNTRGKKSDYNKQLREKQKARRIFGISEKQLVAYYKKALKSAEQSGEELVRQMEHRLDNVIFRAGFATTRRQARQFVSHGMFRMNGKKATIPSMQVDAGDEIVLRDRNKTMPAFEAFDKRKLTNPQWIKVDQSTLSATVVGKAQKDDLEALIDPRMIIEFYSR